MQKFLKKIWCKLFHQKHHIGRHSCLFCDDWTKPNSDFLSGLEEIHKSK